MGTTFNIKNMIKFKSGDSITFSALRYAKIVSLLTFTIFYKKNFIKTRGSFLFKFKNKLRTIPASLEEQSLKISIRVVNKRVASATQFTKCILLFAYSCNTAAAQAQTKTSYSLFNKLP